MKIRDSIQDNTILRIDHPAYASILKNIGVTFPSEIKMSTLVRKARCAFILGVGPHVPNVNFGTFGLTYRGLSQGYAIQDMDALNADARERALNFAHLFRIDFRGETFSCPLRGRFLVHRDTGLLQLPGEFAEEVKYQALPRRFASRLIEMALMSMREFGMFTRDDLAKISDGNSWPKGIEVVVKSN